MFLARPYGRSADVLSHCVVFLSELSQDEVPESDALALARLLMKAHGFPEDELKVLSQKSRKAGMEIGKKERNTGTTRKRRRKVISNYFKLVESHLESRRIHKKEPPFPPNHYKQRQD